MKLSELIIEKLLEQRDTYLNMLKHLDFELAIDDGSDIEKIEKLKIVTIDQIKKVEREIAFLYSKNPK
jgi:regulator of PEP synthase PpsR (kinase-PPPase family)